MSVELSGWRKRQIALDIKADNARELGLDYEPDKTIEMAREAAADALEKSVECMCVICKLGPPQRTWVGLTDEERQDIATEVPIDAVFITEAKLKEKNFD